MKKTFILILMLSFNVLIAQNKRVPLEYINITSLAGYNNNENYFSQKSTSRQSSPSFGADIESIHGLKICEVIAISAGTSLDWNMNKTFISNPYILDLRLFSSPTDENGMFVYFQTGKNIKWSKEFAGNRVTSKIGVGFVIHKSKATKIYFAIFKKSKQIETAEFVKNGTYNISSLGASLGFGF